MISNLNLEKFIELLEDELTFAKKRGGSKCTKTDEDYLKLAELIVLKSESENLSIEDTLKKTKSSKTFYKRLSAIRWFVIKKAAAFSDGVTEQHRKEIPLLLNCLEALKSCRESGFTCIRAKRKSKRASITKLPTEWREALCDRASHSPYYKPLLICCITGCRPSEIVSGVKLWISFNSEMNENCLHIKIKGTKVKLNQGQESRTLIFKTSHKNSILQKLIVEVKKSENHHELVTFKNANNFTQEIRRMSKLLWPKHKHSITAYSIRHQVASDFKKLLEPTDVSRALGHISDKTKKTYGSASQSKSALAPDIILSTREVKLALVKKVGKEDSFEP